MEIGVGVWWFDRWNVFRRMATLLVFVEICVCLIGVFGMSAFEGKINIFAFGVSRSSAKFLTRILCKFDRKKNRIRNNTQEQVDLHAAQ